MQFYFRPPGQTSVSATSIVAKTKQLTDSVATSLQASYTYRSTAAAGEASADFAGRGCCVVNAADTYCH
jgi:hypothetical protein